MERQVQRNKGFPYLVDAFQKIRRRAAEQKESGSGCAHPGEYRDAKCLGDTRKPLMHAAYRHLAAQQITHILARRDPLLPGEWRPAGKSQRPGPGQTAQRSQ